MSPVRADEPDLEALEQQAFQEAAALASPSVVRIQTVGGLDRVGGVLTGTGPTTGVVVSEDGYIISSAFNFIARPASVLVQLPDGRRLPAEQVATDHLKMLTLLKVEAENLVPAQPAKNESLRVGQWALALGRTYDEAAPSVSVGIISARNRIWGKAIQTDAKVSPVNYGGPLVNLDGKVMGVLVPLSPKENRKTAGVEWYDSGIGFAIPLEDIYGTLDRLKQGDDLHPGLLGVSLKSRSLYAGEPVLGRVRVESPADKAGLKPGDVIASIAGRKIRRQADVKRALGTRYAGDTVTVTVERDGETLDREITLAAELEPYEAGFLGILPVREAAGGDRPEGVGVRYVYAGSPAEDAGLRTRDRIVGFGGESVADADELDERVARMRPGETVQLTYTRDGSESTVEVELAAVPTEVPGELPSSPIPAPPETPEEEKPKTGRFTETVPGGEHEYWAYAPDGYHPDYEHGLMVWIHPAGDTMQAAVFEQWKAICDRRGLILLAPKAKDPSGWKPNEAPVVEEAVKQFRDRYRIDADRVFLHGLGDGGRFAYQLAFKYRELFRGVATVSAPLRAQPPENDPDYPLQFHLVCGKEDGVFRAVNLAVDGLRSLKYPVSFTAVEGKLGEYPSGAAVREIGRWADCLDRM